MHEHAPTLRKAVAEAMKQAWSLKTVVYELPEREEATPYGVILTSVDHGEPDAVHSEATYAFACIGRFKKPAGGGHVKAEVKEARIRALVPILLAGPNFATVGYLPRITGTEYEEQDSPDLPYYEVGVEFTVCAQEVARYDLPEFVPQEP